uniref:Uncharacterized protein n=1 Tax=Desertifilum tharense IPPAS B-1220 TaxID=1781255 RepID=A0A1E5QQD1_9CYAN|nr:hypothetical protein BH720_02180 [Desertifilum tharense IPPAS B-1220]
MNCSIFWESKIDLLFAITSRLAAFNIRKGSDSLKRCSLESLHFYTTGWSEVEEFFVKLILR